MIEWADLHDAILYAIKIDPEEAKAELSLLLGYGAPIPLAGNNQVIEQPVMKALIQVQGLLMLIYPHKQPWGISPPKYILEANEPAMQANGQMILNLEMQTGDVIQIEAKAINLLACP
ncbi:hypothetical protein J7643_07630 [bacterium]|nr:hypothetical protein [bacterium]